MHEDKGDYHRRLSASGFTLLEIMIAVVILASSLTILLGLQSANVQSALRARNMTRAVSLGRAVLSTIDSEMYTPDTNSTNVPALDFIEEHRLDKIFSPEEMRDFERFAISETIDSFPLSVSPTQSAPLDITHYTLLISWGDTSDQAFQIHYLLQEPTN